jgi:hypothetical protein
MKRTVSWLAPSLLSFGLASAQVFRGGIQGVITDESGAVLNAAIVKAASTATGQVYSTLSSSAGEFAFHDLPLGEYSVSITRPASRR